MAIGQDTFRFGGGGTGTAGIMGPYDPNFRKKNPALDSFASPFFGRNAIQDLLGPFLRAQEQSLAGFQRQLQQYAAPLRNLLFQSNPELAQASQYLQDRFAQPIPQQLMQNYRENIQSAQASRGFEGGEGPATQEAQFLTTLQEQTRAGLLPQLQNFGSSILGMTGLNAPNIQFPTFAGAYTQQQQLGQGAFEFDRQMRFNQMQFEEQLRANQAQSDFGRAQFADTQRQIDEFNRLQVYQQGGINIGPPGWTFIQGQWYPPGFRPAWDWAQTPTGFAKGSASGF